MSEQKFKEAKGDLAFSQMLRDTLLMHKSSNGQAESTPPEMNELEGEQIESSEVSNGRESVENEVDQLEQNVMDLSQRVDVLEAEEKQPEME